MNLHAPQLIMICLLVLSFGLTWAKHGEPKEGRECAWVSLIGIALQLWLMWWGGFFHQP